MNNQDYKGTKYIQPFIGSKEDPIDLTGEDDLCWDDVSLICGDKVLFEGDVEILFSSDDSRDDSRGDSSDDSSDNASDDSCVVIDVDEDEKVKYKGTVGSANPNSEKSPYFFDSTDSDTDSEIKKSPYFFYSTDSNTDSEIEESTF